MNDSPLIIFLYSAIALYLAYLYCCDTKAFCSGLHNSKALPGAMPISFMLVAFSILAGAFLLANAVLGEYALGLVELQNDMVWFFLFAALSAGVIEELIFRGYLVIENKGSKVLVLSCIGFSFLFALIHPNLWSLDGGFHWIFSTKAFYDTWILVLNSIIFYGLRFGPWNPLRSIFPSMIAHGAFNFGVFGVKWFQGYIVF